MTPFIGAFVGALVAVILALIFLVWFFLSWLPRQPVDRDEDREQSDRDVQQIKDSMRGVL